jgi:predicted alpha/beta hydrolase
VVHGQRMMQAASDIFLGWARGQVDVERSYYWRQLRDMKGSAVVESMAPLVLSFYAGVCGWSLARAHARSGDPVAIAEYLGEDDQFDRSIGNFAKRYADQNELDYEAFVGAVRSGRLAALEGR